jgi:hypothetical protein
VREMKRVLTKEEIILKARNSDGFFTVDRNSYSKEKLRKKLKAMSKDKSCSLFFYSKTQKYIIYSI